MAGGDIGTGSRRARRCAGTGGLFAPSGTSPTAAWARSGSLGQRGGGADGRASSGPRRVDRGGGAPAGGGRSDYRHPPTGRGTTDRVCSVRARRTRTAGQRGTAELGVHSGRSVRPGWTRVGGPSGAGLGVDRPGRARPGVFTGEGACAAHPAGGSPVWSSVWSSGSESALLDEPLLWERSQNVRDQRVTRGKPSCKGSPASSSPPRSISIPGEQPPSPPATTAGTPQEPRSPHLWTVSSARVLSLHDPGDERRARNVTNRYLDMDLWCRAHCTHLPGSAPTSPTPVVPHGPPA